MCFLFRLDLSLHAGAGKKIWNFEFRNQTRAWLTSTAPPTLFNLNRVGEVALKIYFEEVIQIFELK